jgi:hypothetical protein
MIEVIFKIFLTDYIDFQGFITKRIQKPLLIEYKNIPIADERTFDKLPCRVSSIRTCYLSNSTKN